MRGLIFCTGIQKSVLEIQRIAKSITSTETSFTGTCNYLYIGPVTSYSHVCWIGLEVNVHRKKDWEVLVDDRDSIGFTCMDTARGLHGIIFCPEIKFRCI